MPAPQSGFNPPPITKATNAITKPLITSHMILDRMPLTLFMKPAPYFQTVLIE
ncbi:hypothetical protein CEV33_1100 [Brucella grignonensis]|uniref:Uncharacterized protein n=1 Tax=Brucella grignonensis TaxID=94627 RepID=A0A256FCC2_9HYPH|nr:hypothetical protein CEV33_1100 [Brucella grignonensis]